MREHGILLFFADDLFLFGEACTDQVDTMVECIENFAKASRQRMNKTKTKICFSKNVHSSRTLSLSQRMGVGLTADLGKYLGVNLFHQRVYKTSFAPILEKTKRKLSGWKRNSLNLAVRATLIKAALSTLPYYHIQTTILPKWVIQELEKHSRNFLWGEDGDNRKVHLVSWDLVTNFKVNGGMGLKKLRQQNEAFIMKLCWHISPIRKLFG